MPKKTGDESVVVKAAKAIGGAAGKAAVVTGGAAAPEHKQESPKAARAGKLPKKDKARLPRRVKKARNKAGAAK